MARLNIIWRYYIITDTMETMTIIKEHRSNVNWTVKYGRLFQQLDKVGGQFQCRIPHVKSIKIFWSIETLKDESGEMHSDFPGLVQI